MNRDRYLSAVYNWMIRQNTGWIMKNFARLLKKEWNHADIFSQGEYERVSVENMQLMDSRKKIRKKQK